MRTAGVAFVINDRSAKHITFDRRRGLLTNADLRQKIGIMMLRMYYQASTPMGRLGISRVSGVLGLLFLPRGSTTYILDQDARYTIPSGDYYWSVLYVQRHNYEPELELALKMFREIDFAFLDLGANYGYWSILASSPGFGTKPAIAVEAAARAYSILEANALENHSRFRTLKGAIWSTSGEDVKLYGKRHGGLSMVSKRIDGADTYETVKTLSIDDIVHDNRDLIGERPLVIKLDVEGVELQAIQGAEKSLQREFVLIFEDDKWEHFGELPKFLRDHFGCRLYFFHREEKRWLSIVTDEHIGNVKKTARVLRQAGFNFFATREGSVFDRILMSAVNSTGHLANSGSYRRAV